MLARLIARFLKLKLLSCSQVQQSLVAYNRNDMSIAEMQAIQKHLAGCGLCREQLAELQALEADLYSEAARRYPVLDLATEQRLHNKLTRTLHKGVTMARLNQAFRNTIRLGGVAGGILLVLAAVYYLRLGDTPGQVDPTSVATSDKPSMDDTSDVITFAAYEVSQPFYERMIEQFNQQTPDIQVQFVPLSDEGFTDTLSLASAADVVLLPFSLPSESGAYFHDLQPLMEMDANFNPPDFWPGMLEACKDAEGKQVGVPLYASLWGIFYDRSAFDAAGLVYPSPGWTVDDLRQASQVLGKGEEGTTRYGFVDNSHLSGSVLRPYVEAQLIRGPIDNPQDLALNLEQELEWYMELARSGEIQPIGAQMSEWEALFTAGSPPAMWVGPLGQDMPGSTSAFNPQQPLEGLTITQHGYAPYPAGARGGASGMTPFNPACAVISTGSTDPRRSWDWLGFLSRQEHIENQGMGNQLFRVPARQSVAESTGFFTRIPGEQQAAVRYALEHLWPGIRSSQAINILHGALVQALSGSARLLDALANGLAELAAEPPAVVETQELAVATPQPTLSPGQTSARFYFLPLSEGEKTALNTLGEAYNQAHPETYIRVLFNYDLPQDLNFMRAFAEQFDCYTWYSPGFFDPSEISHMLPLDAFFEAEPVSFSQDFYSEQLDLYRSEGRLYGLPAVSQPQVIYYNADLLRKRGITIPEPDWTYEDFLALAHAATSQDPADPSYGFLFDEWESLFDAFHQVEWMDSQDLSQPRAYFDSSQVLNFLTWLSEMRGADVLFIKYDSDFMPAWKAFQDGQIAFWVSPAGNPFTYYFADSIETTYEIGVLPLPSLPGNAKYDSIPISRGYFISPRSESQQVCWDWIQFLTEQPNAMEGVPARSSISTSPTWTALVGERQAEAYRLAVQQYDNTLDYNHIGGAYYTWRHEAIRAALSGTSLESLLARLQTKADRYLACMIEADAPRLGYMEMVATRERCTAAAES